MPGRPSLLAPATRARGGARRGSYDAQSTFSTSRCSSSGPLEADRLERAAEISTEVRVRFVVGKDVDDDKVAVLAPCNDGVGCRETVAELTLPELDGTLPLREEIIYIARVSNRDQTCSSVRDYLRDHRSEKNPSLAGASESITAPSAEKRHAFSRG